MLIDHRYFHRATLVALTTPCANVLVLAIMQGSEVLANSLLIVTQVAINALVLFYSRLPRQKGMMGRVSQHYNFILSLYPVVLRRLLPLSRKQKVGIL